MIDERSLVPKAVVAWDDERPASWPNRGFPRIDGIESPSHGRGHKKPKIVVFRVVILDFGQRTDRSLHSAEGAELSQVHTAGHRRTEENQVVHRSSLCRHGREQPAQPKSEESDGGCPTPQAHLLARVLDAPQP